MAVIMPKNVVFGHILPFSEPLASTPPIEYHGSVMRSVPEGFERYLEIGLHNDEPGSELVDEMGPEAFETALHWWSTNELTFMLRRNRADRRRMLAQGTGDWAIRHTVVEELYRLAVLRGEAEDAFVADPPEPFDFEAEARKRLRGRAHVAINKMKAAEPSIIQAGDLLRNATFSAVSLLYAIRDKHAKELVEYLETGPPYARYAFVKQYSQPAAQKDARAIGKRRLLRSALELTNGGGFLDGLASELEVGAYDRYVFADILRSADSSPRPVQEQLRYLKAVINCLGMEGTEPDQLHTAMIASLDVLPSQVSSEIVAARLALKHLFDGERQQDKTFLVKRDLTASAEELAAILRAHEERAHALVSGQSRRRDEKRGRQRQTGPERRATEPEGPQNVDVERPPYIVETHLHRPDGTKGERTTQAYLAAAGEASNISDFPQVVNSALEYVARNYGSASRQTGIKNFVALRGSYGLYEFKAREAGPEFEYRHSWLAQYRVIVHINPADRGIALVAVVPRKDMKTWLRNNTK